jgi:hypothetical protein
MFTFYQAFMQASGCNLLHCVGDSLNAIINIRPRIPDAGVEAYGNICRSRRSGYRIAVRYAFFREHLRLRVRQAREPFLANASQAEMISVLLINKVMQGV